MTVTATETPAPTLEQVDPATLLVDVNLRSDARLDPEFVGSIRDLGVLVPIVAVRTPGGALRVRLGHRRALGAVKAGRPVVPVLVTDDAGADDARIVAQWAENEHRAALSNGDRLAAVEQLALLGVTADAIAKRTHTSRADVDHAIAAAGSDIARAAVNEFTALSLDQAAVLAEFDTDTEVVASLLRTATRDPGGFDHFAQRQRDNRERARKAKAAAEKLQAAGTTVVDDPGYSAREKPARLENLLSAAGAVLNGKTHKTCPGHAAYLDYSAETRYACTDWRANGHRGRWASVSGGSAKAADPEKAKAERRTVIENNKA